MTCSTSAAVPAPYDATVKPFQDLAKILNLELDRLFPKDVQVLAEPGRFLVATADFRVGDHRQGRAGGKLCYTSMTASITPSRRIFDHCQSISGHSRRAALPDLLVFGPTCDALDVVSMAEELPADLQLGDLIYSKNSAPTATPPPPLQRLPPLRSCTSTSDAAGW